MGTHPRLHRESGGEGLNTLKVLGEAAGDLAPDRVEWTLSVQETDADPHAALERCTERAAAIAGTLGAFTVTTGHVQVGDEWHHSGHKTTGRKIAAAGLRVSAPLDQAGAVASAGLAAGVDDLSGPRLLYPDATALFDALLPQAVEAARRNADALAAAAGRRAGRVLEITDPRANDSDGIQMLRAGAASGGGHDLPVIAEPRRITATLIVTFELTD